MILASIIFSAAYLGVCFFLASGLKNIAVCTQNSTCRKPVSVIICAKDEEKNIANLLECLLLQTYPKNLTQIIIVNDRSSDKTAETALSYNDKFENFLLLNIEKQQSGAAPKKFAFSQGLNRASGEIIVQTDADSLVPSDWIETIIEPFSDESVALVQGIVKYRFDKPIPFFLKMYQTLDFLSHGIVAAAGIGKNIPLNANANNFALCKEAYENLGGYGKLIEATCGDDGLITQKIWQAGKKIVFNANSVVKTKAEYSWKNLINQRARWGSQTQFYMPKQTVILGVIFTFYCFIAVLFPILLALKQNFLLIFVLFGVKIIGESFLLSPGLSIFAEKKLLPHIIWTSPLNLLITIYSVFGGIFGKFDWKGARFSAKAK